jgi:hypothetical protein
MTWARFPYTEVERTADGHRVWIIDARYARSRHDRFGVATVDVPGSP